MNRTTLPSLLSGILFGAGLALGGMTDPARVRGFLDLFGDGIEDGFRGFLIQPGQRLEILIRPVLKANDLFTLINNGGIQRVKILLRHHKVTIRSAAGDE